MGSALIHGVAASLMSFHRGTFWVLLLTYFHLPKSARAYLFPLTKLITLAATPVVLTPFVRDQGVPGLLGQRPGLQCRHQVHRPPSARGAQPRHHLPLVLRATETTLAETTLADLRARAARVCRCKCTGCTTRKVPLRSMTVFS